MNQDEIEELILRVIAIGAILSIVEFVVISVVVEGGGLAGYHYGLMAGIFMIIITVIMVFFASAFIKPRELTEG